MTGADPTVDRRLDEEALRALSTAYAAAVDACDGAMLTSLFVPEGELVVPNYPDDLRPTITRKGHEALRRLPDGLRRYHRTFHQVSNHNYAIEGDRATGKVLCVAHHVTGAGGRAEDGRADDGRAGTDTVWFIRYVDEYRRTGAGWRIERRQLHLLWVEERPVAVLGAAPPGRGPG
ncbi:MAG TPA: nuclear transport factor 2 family protein [Acidimicrobiales bacterium]|nr:nuclear transport factor 2 family protein [Acidimicrobiales bacterium]